MRKDSYNSLVNICYFNLTGIILQQLKRQKYYLLNTQWVRISKCIPMHIFFKINKILNSFFHRDFWEAKITMHFRDVEPCRPGLFIPYLSVVMLHFSMEN